MDQTEKNVLFLLIDALRADKCYGKGSTAVAPAINSLIQRGTAFTQAIATTSTTSPSVASVMTGVYPPTHGVRSLIGYKLNYDVATCAEILRDNGYNTYAEVTGPLVPEIGLHRGFDRYCWRETARDAYSDWGRGLVRRFVNREFKQPWFVFVHFWELHMPRIVPKGFNKNQFGVNRYERAVSALDAYLQVLLAGIGSDVLVVFHADHGEEIAETKKEEFLLTSRKILWRQLRRIGLKKGSILKSVGHGFHIYDSLVRVPLVFSGHEAFPSNTAIGEQVSQVDVLPTLVDALNLEVQDDFSPEGRSLMPLVRGQKLQGVPVFCEACGSSLSDESEWLLGIRTPKYKYVYAPHSEEAREELFDLDGDPRETRNLVRENPKVVQELKGVLQERSRSYKEKGRIKRRIKGLKSLSRI